RRSPSDGRWGNFYRKMQHVSADPGVPAGVRTLAKAASMSLAFRNHPVGKHAPVRAVARLWAWQVWRRTVRRPLSIELHDGSRFICPEWSALSGSLVAVGLTDVAELSFVVDVIRDGDV